MKPLWKQAGGRDELARVTGIRGSTLSHYNGTRSLGWDNGQKIAEGLTLLLGRQVTLQELGAPLEADGRQQAPTLYDRLTELGEKVDALEERQARVIEVLELVLERLPGEEPGRRAAGGRAR